MSPLEHVCLGLALDTIAAAGGELEGQRGSMNGLVGGLEGCLPCECSGPSFRS